MWENKIWADRLFKSREDLPVMYLKKRKSVISWKFEFWLILKPAKKMEQYQNLGDVTNKAYLTHIIPEDHGITFLKYWVWRPEKISEHLKLSDKSNIMVN